MGGQGERHPILQRMLKVSREPDPSSLARVLDMSPAAVSKRGARPPSDRMIVGFCLKYRVSLRYLMTGEGQVADPDPVEYSRVIEAADAYLMTPGSADLMDRVRGRHELVPWLHGLAAILESGDEEKVAAIRGNIQAFLEALDMPRVGETRGKVGRARRGRKRYAGA